MPEILIASMSPAGHIGPLLNVAQGLVDRGDRVTVLTAAAHARKIRAIGAIPAAIPADADFDVTRLDLDLPGRAETSGIKRVNFDITRIFVAPMPLQTRALSELMAQTRFDAILTDAGFFGILPFLLGDPAARPPVLTYTTTPLMLSSRDTAPCGLGMAAVVDCARAAAQPGPDPAVAQGVAARFAERGQSPARSTEQSPTAHVHPRLRRAGRPLHRPDGARVRLPPK